MKKLILFVSATLWASQLFSVTTYTVSSTGTNSGTSWTTVKAAITAAASGDIIQITAGTFTEKNITLNAVKSLTIQGAGMNQTIIQADASTSITQASDCGVFKLDGTYTAGITITIQDMTIQNGYNSFSGGGLRLTNTGTQANAPTLNLTNLKISANRSTYGGGIYIAGAAILNITACNITGNSMTNSSNIGGGIAVSPGAGYVATVTIKNSTIAANSSLGNGSGIAVNCGANGTTAAANYLWIENSTIYGNSIGTAAKIGAGVYFKTCTSGQTSVPTFTLTMNHCTIANNTTIAGSTTTTSGPDGVAIENGGGYATTIVMNNSIIMGNNGSTGSNACQIGSNNTSTSTTANGKITASPVITNSIFGIIASGGWVAGANISHNDITGTATMAFAGSLSSDATPVLLIGSGSTAKDYVTTNLLSPALSTDQIGNSRSGLTDAGAYEYNASLAIAASAIGGSVSSGTGNYASGATATLVATATGSNVFANWTENGVIVSTSASYAFTVTKARTLVANFTVQYNVQTANDGNGSVTGAATVVSGNPVTLTATPNAGYAFSAWTITAGTTPAISATTNPLTFTPTADCTLSAGFASIAAFTPTATYARTATTIDVLVTNPTAYAGTLTYNVLDANDNVLATAIAATSSPQTATLVYSATGLAANSSHIYKVVAVINGINSLPATITALTRKHANGSLQVIDDFEDGNAMGWINQSSATLTIPYTNTVTAGINASTNCAKANILSGKNNFSGFLNSLERFQIGPNAPYQYLHIKMYRDADNGTLGLTFMTRTDITQVQQAATETPAVSVVSASGPWVDYVFDLKNAAYTSDKTYFGFYIKPNKTTSTTNVESNNFIDDVYLSNNATPSTSNITIPVTITAGAGGTVSQSSKTFLSGDNATVVATPNSGYHFVNWTLNTSAGAVQSTSASYSFTVTAAKTLVANFALTVSADANLSTYSPTSATDVTVTAGELTVDADATVKTMTVAPGAKLTLASGKTLTVIGALTLQSDATGTATFVDNGGTVSAGCTNVQQYLTTGRNWYVSSPVSAATAAVFNPAGLSNLLYSYDETHGSTAPWPAITNNATGLTVMKGYVANMASSGVVTFTGTLNTGAQEIGLTQTSGQVKNGFNLVGNPYPSYLDWSSITKTNMLTTMWYRTKTSGDVYTFDTYNASGNIATSNGAKAVTNLIPPMQAFWVHVQTGFASSTLAVTNAQRAHADNSSNTFKAKAVTSQSVLRLVVSNGINSDQALVNFNSNASNGLDSYDSPKLSNESASMPEIYTLAGSEQLVINGVNDATELALGFTTGEANNFSIKASQFANFASGTQIILRDNLLNYEQDLTLADYNFYSDVTANNETRFTVLFKAPSVATGINPNTTGNVWISINGNNQIVVNGANAGTTVAVYNAVGQKIMSDLTQLRKSLATGVYMVTVTNAGKSVTLKVIIK